MMTAQNFQISSPGASSKTRSILFFSLATPIPNRRPVFCNRPNRAKIQLDPDEPAQTLRCHIEKFQFSAPHRGNRCWPTRSNLRRKKSCSCTAIRRRWNGCGNNVGNCRESVIVPAPGIEFDL